MAETLLAIYDSLDHADMAVRELVSAGFDRSDIGLAARDHQGNLGSVDRLNRADEDEDVDAGEGAGFGALVGGLTGIVMGLTAITIPGIGAILAAGPLAAALGGATGAAIGAAAGAVTGGLVASLVDMGVPEDHAEYYAESVRRGSALVSVTVRDESQVSHALDVLRRHHPVNVERRATQWKMKGWKGFDPLADPYTAVEREGEESHVESPAVGSLSHAETDTDELAVRRYPSNRP